MFILTILHQNTKANSSYVCTWKLTCQKTWFWFLQRFNTVLLSDIWESCHWWRHTYQQKLQLPDFLHGCSGALQVSQFSQKETDFLQQLKNCLHFCCLPQHNILLWSLCLSNCQMKMLPCLCVLVGVPLESSGRRSCWQLCPVDAVTQNRTLSLAKSSPAVATCPTSTSSASLCSVLTWWAKLWRIKDPFYLFCFNHTVLRSFVV